MPKQEPKPNTILLPVNATSLIQHVMASLTENQLNPQLGEETVVGIKLVKITYGKRPGEGQIAQAMKARRANVGPQ